MTIADQSRLVALLVGLFLVTVQGALVSDDEAVGIDKIEYVDLLDQYMELSDVLLENVPEEDAESNLRYAQNLLEKKTHEEGANENDPFVVALKLFASLASTKNKCDSAAFLVLMQNKKAGGHRANMWISKFNNPRRADRIAKEMALEHADECKEAYKEKFEAKYPNLDRALMNRLEDVFDLTEVAPNRAKAAPILFNAIVDKTLISDVLQPSSLYEKLTTLAKDDPEQKYLHPIDNEKTGRHELIGDKFKIVYDRYITEPCQYLLEQLAQDIFRPLTFEAYAHDVDESKPEFYYTWARSELCHHLVTSDSRAAYEVPTYELIMRHAASQA